VAAKLKTDNKNREEVRVFSESLIKIHRILMEGEFAKLEQVHGKLSPVTRLQMLLHGPELAWLRPLSQLMAKVDEVLFQKEPIEEKRRAEVLHEMREFFILEGNKVFSDHLNERCKVATGLTQEIVKLKTLITS
jgi:hypothetical protein